ncbi:hypothetical protein [Pandoraea sp. B-6]|uniref:hypothetical protein n=1 Tax=Pandoraea sp. B-6 TaxID=1204340 RepID=UPI00036804DA|nr:hypothetical protein [Pandoraea sp. B-6]
MRLYADDGFDEDLQRLADDPLTAQDAVRIKALTDQIDESEDALWSLIQRDGEHPDPLFSVKAVAWMNAAGYNISRIRFHNVGLSRYRILICYDNEYDDFYLLAIVVKDLQIAYDGNEPYHLYDYERDHLVTRRMLADYDRLGVPKIR